MLLSPVLEQQVDNKKEDQDFQVEHTSIKKFIGFMKTISDSWLLR